MSNQKQSSATKATNFFINLAKGEFGLKETFWTYGVLVNLLSIIFLPVSVLLGETLFLLIFSVLFIVYSPLFVMGLIQSAKNYKGKKVWARLAMVYAAFWVLMFLAVFGVFLLML